MLLNHRHCAFLMIDVQERLLPAMHDPEQLVDHCAWLLRLTDRLAVPVLASEQYPRGLGATEPRLRELLPGGSIMEKVHFSCTAQPECLDRLKSLDRPQWVLAGIEAHVCVLQTALGLLARGKQVYVVADAVDSRRPNDRALGLERLRAEGVRIVSREMVAYEWLEQAGDDRFRAISREFLR